MVPAQKKAGLALSLPALSPGFIAFVGVLYLRFVALTSRIRVHFHPGALYLADGRRPCVFAFWHRYQLMMGYAYRNRGAHVLVSRSGDGELIARALHLMGYGTVRGSSTRGGATALMGLLDVLAAGGQLGVTPDGPRGPYRSVQPGLAALARKSGAPVIPGGWAGTRVKILRRSWDRFMVPLPFGRYVVVFGEPMTVSSDENEAEDAIRAALDGAAAEAERLLNGATR